MNVMYLIASFTLLLLLAILIFLAPFRIKGNKKIIFSAFIFCILAIVAYFFWGNWSTWQATIDSAQKQEKAKALLATIGSPIQLAEKLKAQLKQKPSPRGWYLLGRVYQSQQQWQAARKAFKKSLALDANSEATWIHYVESLWQIENQQFTQEIRAVLLQILAKNPKQADALTLLAMDAEIQKDYPKAIAYWQQLLKLLPITSKEAAVIQQRIIRLEVNV